METALLQQKRRTLTPPERGCVPLTKFDGFFHFHCSSKYFQISLETSSSVAYFGGGTVRGFGIPFGRWFSFKVLTAETHFVRSVGLLCVSVRGFVPRPRPRCVSRTPVSMSVAAVGPEESFRQVGGGCCAGPLGNLTVTAGGPRGRTEDTQQIARVRQTPHGLQQRLTPGRCSNAYRKPWAWLPVKMVAAHTGQPRALHPCSAPLGTGSPRSFSCILVPVSSGLYSVFPGLGWRWASGQLGGSQCWERGPQTWISSTPKSDKNTCLRARSL